MLPPPLAGNSPSKMLAGAPTVKASFVNVKRKHNHTLRTCDKTNFAVVKLEQNGQIYHGGSKGCCQAVTEQRPGARVVKKEENCQETGGLLGRERDRLKRVSNHEIPVLTPQLLKYKNSPVASEMHHHLAVSGEMSRLQVRGFGGPPVRQVVCLNTDMLYATSVMLLN